MGGFHGLRRPTVFFEFLIPPDSLNALTLKEIIFARMCASLEIYPRKKFISLGINYLRRIIRGRLLSNREQAKKFIKLFKNA